MKRFPLLWNAVISYGRDGGCLRRTVWGILAYVSLSTAAAATGEPCLKIGILEAFLGPSEIAVLTNSFAKAHLCLVPVVAPAARIQSMEEAGELDGEFVRIPAYFARYPNLLVVPTPAVSFMKRIYWRKGEAEPVEADKTIGRMRGIMWSDLVAATLTARSIDIAHADQMIGMLMAGRIDGFLVSDLLIQTAHMDTSVTDQLTYRDLGVLLSHLAINRRFESYVPALDEAIRQETGRPSGVNSKTP